MSGARPGLVALGDSITNGEGSMALGVTPLSWAHWLARALDLPYTSYAVNGATAESVLAEQVPRLGSESVLAEQVPRLGANPTSATPQPDAAQEVSPAPDGVSYAVGCLYVGVNDVRDVAWDADAYSRAAAAALGALTARCARVVTCTAPLDLGRPRAGAKVGELNAIVRRLAGEHGARVAELHDFGGRHLVLPDAIHPTAVGQVWIAERAARALGAPTSPWELAAPDVSPRALARYAPQYAAAVWRDLLRRAREGTLLVR